MIKFKLLLAHAKLFINRRPRLRRLALAVLVQLPASKIRILLNQDSMLAAKAENLSSRAFCIYTDLKKALKNAQKG
jgi:hypothetical protein